jgi:hypothetical protein
VNRYRYNAPGLFIPYALANLFTLFTILLAAISYWRHGVLPDRKFWDIVRALEEPGPRRVVMNRERRGSMRFRNVESHRMF